MMKNIVRCWDGNRRRLNWIRQPKDARDRNIREFFRVPFSGELPKSVDLRGHCSPVEDQGPIGSCTAQSLAGATEYLSIRQNGGTLPCDKSRLFAYYNGRRAMGPWYVKQDSGCYIRTVVKAAVRYGICSEKEFWPYDTAKFAVKPPVSAYADARRFQVTEYANIEGEFRDETLRNVKLSLARGVPVMCGFDVWSSFLDDAVAKTGEMPVPDIKTEENQGGHAVLIVGYDDALECFIVRNSWGGKWGMGGYFHMPFAILSCGMMSDFMVVTGQETGAASGGWLSGLFGYLSAHREKELAT